MEKSENYCFAILCKKYEYYETANGIFTQLKWAFQMPLSLSIN